MKSDMGKRTNHQALPLSVAGFIAIFLLSPLANSSELGISGRTQRPDVSIKNQIDPALDKLMNGRSNEILEEVKRKYSCEIPEDPVLQAQSLIFKFDLPRDDENMKYQAACWPNAEKLIPTLKKTNPTLSKVLEAKFKINQDALKIITNLKSCSGGDSKFRSRLIYALQTAQPIDNPPVPQVQRMTPVKMPPAVTEQESLNQLRKSIFTEAIAEDAENAILLSKKHNVPMPRLVEDLCPDPSACRKANPSIPQLIKSIELNAEEAKIPRVSDADVFSRLQKAAKNIAARGKEFNSHLHCIEPAVDSSTQKVCVAKNDEPFGDQTLRDLNASFYGEINDIKSSDEGMLLGREPFRTQLRSMYDGIPLGLGGLSEKNSRYNPTSKSNTWDPLPEKLPLMGGPESVREAVRNVASGMKAQAQFLNEIEESAQNGKNVDYLSFGDPNLNAITLLSHHNMRAASRVFLSNPALSKGPLTCRLVAASLSAEKSKEVQAKVQAGLAIGVGTTGAAMLLMPTGVTQVVGPPLIATASTMGVSLSAKAFYDSYNEKTRASNAFAATRDPNLFNDSEQAASEMLANGAQIVGDAAPIFVKGVVATAGASKRALTAIRAMARASRLGENALGEIKSSSLLGQLLGSLPNPEEEIAALNRAAKLNPAGWESLKREINGLCTAGAVALNWRNFLLSLFIDQAYAIAAAPSGVCFASVHDLTALKEKVLQFAHSTKDGLKPLSFASVVKNAPGGHVEIEHVQVMSVNGSNAVVRTQTGSKILPISELTAPIPGNNLPPLNTVNAGSPVYYTGSPASPRKFMGYLAGENKEFLFVRDTPTSTQIRAVSKDVKTFDKNGKLTSEYTGYKIFKLPPRTNIPKAPEAE